jgi:transaldolase
MVFNDPRDSPRRSSLAGVAVECALRRPAVPAAPLSLASLPLLAALRRAGTAHIYADSGDREELGKVLATGDRSIACEVDGNTVNQPLVKRVLDRYLDEGRLPACARELASQEPAGREPAPGRLAPYLYTIVCGWIGRDVVAAFAADRPWEVSLQLHMSAARDAGTARTLGRALRQIVPSGLVKVPFMPDAPGCFLVARDLEREGIPVNFTSTFSARQAVAAALLADVTRTNIFMGRIAQGLEARRLGEHVCLEAQRALRRLRREAGVKTALIVASMREWRTFVDLAGCDVFTAPVDVLAGFLGQEEVAPGDLSSQLETSHAGRLEVAPRVEQALGPDRIARLFRIEPELLEFLRAFRETAEYRAMTSGEALFRRFEEAGFADLFHVPDAAERQALRRSKLPDLAGELTRRLPLDTHYSLLADADFEKIQEAMDAEIDRQARR